MAAVHELSPVLGAGAACRVLGLPRGASARHRAQMQRRAMVGPMPAPPARPRPPLAFSDQENIVLLATLNSALGKGVKVTSVPGLADSAAVLSATERAGGTTVAASGIYLLEGLDFLAFSDVALGKPAPTEAALEAQASTSLGRLP